MKNNKCLVLNFVVGFVVLLAIMAILIFVRQAMISRTVNELISQKKYSQAASYISNHSLGASEDCLKVGNILEKLRFINSFQTSDKGKLEAFASLLPEARELKCESVVLDYFSKYSNEFKEEF